MWLNKQIIALNLSKNFSIFKIKNTVKAVFFQAANVTRYIQ